MSTSGTYSFNPSLGELTLYAFNLAGVRATELQQQHMESARIAANLIQARWSAQGVNLWAVDLQTVALVQGQATYSVDPATVAILDAYLTITSGGATTNRYIMPISRSEFASLAQPTVQGAPSNYWFDRLLAPNLTLWPVPDGNEVSLSFYRLRQIQDAALANGAQVEVPFTFLEAFANALGQRMAFIWRKDDPRIAEELKGLADESYGIATNQNVEDTPVYVTPMLGGYYRP